MVTSVHIIGVPVVCVASCLRPVGCCWAQILLLMALGIIRLHEVNGSQPEPGS